MNSRLLAALCAIVVAFVGIIQRDATLTFTAINTALLWRLVDEVDR